MIIMDSQRKENKIKCGECNMEFESKEKLEEHKTNHSAVYCDTCPIDMAIRRISKLFRRN
jgi:peptide subunit release factor 1 (eRF1)